MRFLCILGLACFFSACDTDFPLEAELQDVPVVYGFLAAGDTAHYLRIERMLLEPGTDATFLAQDPDRLYYDNLSVELEHLATGRRYPLVRVDGDLEGYPRESGPFVESPNYLYKLPAAAIGLQGGEEVHLHLTRGGDAPEVSSTTNVLEPLVVRNNSPFSPVNMRYDRELRFSWGAGESAEVFDVRLRINYLENASGNVADWQPATLEWILDENLLRGGDGATQTVTVLGEEFYRYVGNNLPVEPSIARRFVSFDLLVVAGGTEFVELLRINQANTGITSAQLVPRYSNIDGGLGVFSSRAYLERADLTLTGPSLDSLSNGIYTRSLNFE